MSLLQEYIGDIDNSINILLIEPMPITMFFSKIRDKIPAKPYDEAYKFYPITEGSIDSQTTRQLNRMER